MRVGVHRGGRRRRRGSHAARLACRRGSPGVEAGEQDSGSARRDAYGAAGVALRAASGAAGGAATWSTRGRERVRRRGAQRAGACGSAWAAPRQVHARAWPGQRGEQAALQRAGEERGREKKKRKKEKREGKRKRGKEREKRDRSADSAAATVAGRARAPVGRGARDEEEQGDGTTIGCRDWVFGRSGGDRF